MDLLLWARIPTIMMYICFKSLLDLLIVKIFAFIISEISLWIFLLLLSFPRIVKVVQLILERHAFELCVPSYTWILSSGRYCTSTWSMAGWTWLCGTLDTEGNVDMENCICGELTLSYKEIFFFFNLWRVSTPNSQV